MSTTFTPSTTTRHVITGVSSTPQGADGVSVLARSAFYDMKQGAWTTSSAYPSLPVHEFDRARPSGDAYKAAWGYDSAARTEQSCCGAVCYTVKLPVDAVDQTSSGACYVESVAVRVIGDRYLDAGAKLYIIGTQYADPPPLADFLAASIVSGVLCATAGQQDSSGEDLAPNDRTGVETLATVALPANTAAPAYLHICLALVDYTTTRGAWIEGGAMVVPDDIAIALSRSFTPDEDTDGDTPADPDHLYFYAVPGYSADISSNYGGGIGFSFEAEARIAVSGVPSSENKYAKIPDRAWTENVGTLLRSSAIEPQWNIVRRRQSGTSDLASMRFFKIITETGGGYFSASFGYKFQIFASLWNTPRFMRQGGTISFATITASSLPEGITLGFRHSVFQSDLNLADYFTDTAGGATQTIEALPFVPLEAVEGTGQDLITTHFFSLTGGSAVSTGDWSAEIIKTPTKPFLLLVSAPVSISAATHTADNGFDVAAGLPYSRFWYQYTMPTA